MDLTHTGMTDRSAADQAYAERNQVVALLARLFPAGIRKTAIEGWDPEWQNCVFIDLPTGQVSWHYHDREAHLFAGLPPYTRPWDGHTTPEKYHRLALLYGKSDQAQRAATLAESLRSWSNWFGICLDCGWFGISVRPPDAPNLVDCPDCRKRRVVRTAPAVV